MTYSITHHIHADAHCDLTESAVRALIPSIEEQIASRYPDADIDVVYVNSTGASKGTTVDWLAETSPPQSEDDVADFVRGVVYHAIEMASRQ